MKAIWWRVKGSKEWKPAYHAGNRDGYVRIAPYPGAPDMECKFFDPADIEMEDRHL